MRRKDRHPGTDSVWNRRPVIEGLENRRLLSGSLDHAIGSTIGGILSGLGIPTGGDFHVGHNQYTVGTVISTDTTADTITLSNPVFGSSAPQTYTLASTATITADGSSATLAQLGAGAQVALQLSTTNSVTTVTSITAISQHASGVVSSVDATANTITVTGFSGSNTTYPLAAGATITLDGSASTLGGLTSGDSAQLTLSALDGKTVTNLSARSPDSTGTHHGDNHHVSATVVSVDTTADTLTVSSSQNGSATQSTYTVDPSATITADGTATPLASLLAGAKVQLTVSASSSTTVTAIAASSQHIVGVVSSVDATASTITLLKLGGTTTYTVGSSAVVTVNGATSILSALTANSAAQLTLSAFDGNTVTSISDHSLPAKLQHLKPISATVVSVDATADTITVSTSVQGTATQTTYTLDPSATVTANGSTTTLASLTAGAKVILTLSTTSSTTVTSVNAISPFAAGSVTSVDTTASTITITAQDGTAKTYTVGSTATINLNGASSTLSALTAGTHVNLQLSALDGSTVTNIQARTPAVVTRRHRLFGAVTAVDSTAGTITVSNPFASSSTTTYTLAAGATITADGTTTPLASLQAGAQVVLQLSTTAGVTTVTSIAARAQHAAGVVSSVDTTANTITLTPHGGGTAVTYTLGTGATVTLNGSSSTLASLTAGTHVQLQLSALDGKTVLSIRGHS